MSITVVCDHVREHYARLNDLPPELIDFLTEREEETVILCVQCMEREIGRLMS